MFVRSALGLFCVFALAPAHASDRAAIDALVAQHAQANGIPESLVHRVIRRESNYNPRAASRGNIGLMQIRHGTARGMGYSGSAAGLLDANTNLTYAVAYLADAYRVAGGNPDRAVRLYASGFYYEAKRKGMTGRTLAAARPVVPPAAPAAMVLAPMSFQAAAAVPAMHSVQTGTTLR